MINLIHSDDAPNIAVVIPSYKVTNHILGVILIFGHEISSIYVVDDCCPDKSGDYVETKRKDDKVVLLRHNINQGGAL